MKIYIFLILLVNNSWIFCSDGTKAASIVYLMDEKVFWSRTPEDVKNSYQVQVPCYTISFDDGSIGDQYYKQSEIVSNFQEIFGENIHAIVFRGSNIVKGGPTYQRVIFNNELYLKLTDIEDTTLFLHFKDLTS